MENKRRYACAGSRQRLAQGLGDGGLCDLHFVDSAGARAGALEALSLLQAFPSAALRGGGKLRIQDPQFESGFVGLGKF